MVETEVTLPHSDSVAIYEGVAGEAPSIRTDSVVFGAMVLAGPEVMADIMVWMQQAAEAAANAETAERMLQIFIAAMTLWSIKEVVRLYRDKRGRPPE